MAIIQARMGSKRLPGKVLREIDGQPMLQRVFERASKAKTLDLVVVATSTDPRDDKITDFCRDKGWDLFRGSEHDVLERFYRAALYFCAEAVIRITADCPLIDPEIIDLVVSSFAEKHPDYASNTLERTYPRGLDTEVMTMKALETAWKAARERYERSHVTPYIYENRRMFKLLSIKHAVDYSSYRFTVDTVEDLTFMEGVYRNLGSEGNFRWMDVVHLIEEHPQLAEINREVRQKTLHDG